METFSTVLILIFWVSMSGVIVKIFPLQIPLPLMQIVLGSILAAFNVYETVFDPELFLLLFIPPLLFDDGRKTALKEFIHNGREVINLALILVLVTVVALGFFIHHLFPDIPLPVAMAFAGILSPTDAVALNGIIGRGRIPKDKMEIIEGEALMNDASGLVCLKFGVAIALGSMVFNIWEISLSFLVSAIGGLLTGVVVAWVYIYLLRKINKITDNDPSVQIVLLFILPFVIYLIANNVLHTSGILAVVSAGMTVKQSGMMNKAPLIVRFQSESTWSMLTFLFNGIIFTLLGLQLPGILRQTLESNRVDLSMSMMELSLITLTIYLSLVVIRYLWLYCMKVLPKLPFISRPLSFKNYSQRDLLVSTFAGVRGAISLAGVLSIPAAIYPQGNYELVFITMGVIILSLINATILLPILLKGGIIIDKSVMQDEMKRIKVEMTEEAINSIEKLQNTLLQNPTNKMESEMIHSVGSNVINSLRRRSCIDQESQLIEADELERRMRLLAIGSERTKLYALKSQKGINDSIFDRLLNELDMYEKLLSDD